MEVKTCSKSIVLSLLSWTVDFPAHYFTMKKRITKPKALNERHRQLFIIAPPKQPFYIILGKVHQMMSKLLQICTKYCNRKHFTCVLLNSTDKNYEGSHGNKLWDTLWGPQPQEGLTHSYVSKQYKYENNAFPFLSEHITDEENLQCLSLSLPFIDS